jgi:hypothetical protein
MEMRQRQHEAPHEDEASLSVTGSSSDRVVLEDVAEVRNRSELVTLSQLACWRNV